MNVTIKGIQKGDDLEINLNQKINMIEQAVAQHSKDTSMNQFRQKLGPENAYNMEWPLFRGEKSDKNENLLLLEYDPDAEAAKAKIAGQSGSNEVAQNEMTGELANQALVLWLTFLTHQRKLQTG